MGCGKLPEDVAPETVGAAAGPYAEASSALRPRLALTLPGRFREDIGECLTAAVAPGCGDLEELAVEVKNGERVLGRAQKSYPGTSCELRFDIVGMQPGTKLLTIELACRRPGADEDEVYAAQCEATVLPRARSVQVNQTISVNGNYGNDFENAKIGVVDIPKEEDGDRAPEVKVPELRLVRSPRRMLLECGKDVVQLLAVEKATFGRGRTNTVTLRVFDADGRPDDDASKRISSVHFSLGLSEAGCVVSDGAERASTNGTRVDDAEVRWGASRTLRTGRHEIRLGSGLNDFVIDVQVVSNDLGVLQGCVFTRRDGARRRTLALVHALELDAGARVAWDGARFVFVGADGSHVLAPGEQVEFEGRRWTVSSYRPTWIR